METIYQHAQEIIKQVIKDNMPKRAVETALAKHNFKKNIYMIAIGKAAWTMAESAVSYLGNRLKQGIVITKYQHSNGPINNVKIFEAGHPVSDDNTILATTECINLVKNLGEEDELLFLVSGGGSALFEAPLKGITLEDLQNITNQLLASGADIVEINMVRKRFSAVKAGRFAQLIAPCNIFAIVLSDVLGDRLDSIASGPVVADTSTIDDAKKVVEKYNLKLNDLQSKYLLQETPKEITNVTTTITGSVRTLCESAARVSKNLGYTPIILTTTMNCEASEAGRLIASIAADTQNEKNSFTKPCAIILGGETVVTLKGNGKGGRNQEIALSAVNGIAGLKNTLVFSLGSDGTDGPTDAAGGIVTGKSLNELKNKGLNVHTILSNNDAYTGLKAINSLIITGPTGTNVNDITVILCK